MPELERLHSPATTRAANTTTTTATLHRSIAAHDVCSAQPGELSAREQRNHRENWEPEKWREHAVAAAAAVRHEAACFACPEMADRVGTTGNLSSTGNLHVK